ncbi:MAG: carboxypeptidase regulatory-like domain-containing protein, partial [Anaerolineae bacterium]|nr:carboxypeptidase regulatory-like domain-containing protein [Anaerolineae bacterium]
MSQKSRLVRSLLLISLLFSLVSQLALAMPLLSRNPDPGDPVAASPEIANADNVIQGHALTDEATPQPVQNALIVAKKTVGGDEETTLTDASGAYTLTVPSGGWWVSAVVTDTTTPSNVVPPAHPQWVYFLPGGPYTETRNFAFTVPEAQIVGRVLVAGTLITPTCPVTVTATGLVRVSEQIDANGFFTLTVPAGLYVVTVRPENLLLYLPPAPVQGYVSDGETWDLGDLYLIPFGDAATLSGQVLTPDGQGVPGLRVVAYNLDRTTLLPSRSTTTEEPNGDFTLTVQAGTWWVAVALGEGDDYMPYRLQWQTVVSVEPGGTVDDIVLRVTPA